MKNSKKKKDKKKYEFPNDWQFFKNLKPKHFNRLTFSEVMEDIASPWVLPPDVTLVARAHHIPSGRITEQSFTSVKDVRKFMKAISMSGEHYHIHCFDHHQTFTAVFNDD